MSNIGAYLIRMSGISIRALLLDNHFYKRIECNYYLLERTVLMSENKYSRHILPAPIMMVPPEDGANSDGYRYLSVFGQGVNEGP